MFVRPCFLNVLLTLLLQYLLHYWTNVDPYTYILNTQVNVNSCLFQMFSKKCNSRHVLLSVWPVHEPYIFFNLMYRSASGSHQVFVAGQYVVNQNQGIDSPEEGVNRTRFTRIERLLMLY